MKNKNYAILADKGDYIYFFVEGFIKTYDDAKRRMADLQAWHNNKLFIVCVMGGL